MILRIRNFTLIWTLSHFIRNTSDLKLKTSFLICGTLLYIRAGKRNEGVKLTLSWQTGIVSRNISSSTAPEDINVDVSSFIQPSNGSRPGVQRFAPPTRARNSLDDGFAGFWELWEFCGPLKNRIYFTKQNADTGYSTEYSKFLKAKSSRGQQRRRYREGQGQCRY